MKYSLKPTSPADSGNHVHASSAPQHTWGSYSYQKSKSNVFLQNLLSIRSNVNRVKNRMGSKERVVMPFLLQNSTESISRRTNQVEESIHEETTATGITICESPAGKKDGKLMQLAIPIIRFAALPVDTRTGVFPVMPQYVFSPAFDLDCDIRTVCSGGNTKANSQFISQMLMENHFFLYSTPWAFYLLQLVKDATKRGVLLKSHANSIRWVICMYARAEVDKSMKKNEAKDRERLRQMTNYRNAIECITGTPVIKYGRKGKPHLARLYLENGSLLRWTSRHRKNQNKFILIESIEEIRLGTYTDVFTRAIAKKMLPLSKSKCTLSLITTSRTLDLQTRNTMERDWLRQSFEYLIHMTKERQLQLQKQTEISIIKRMEQLQVWKHGRKGKPHRTYININRYGEISWSGRNKNCISLREIISIEKGHQTQVFKRIKNRKHEINQESRCFSLITCRRTLDIETENEQECD